MADAISVAVLIVIGIAWITPQVRQAWADARQARVNAQYRRDTQRRY